jgi:glycosyltransferase involved in cell wall biosynthesis
VLAAESPVPVRFLGMRRDVRRLLTAFDLFVLPSRSEGLPLALLEAMAAGCPVVATRVGEVATVLREGALGALVPAEEPLSLAHAMTAAMHDANARQRVAHEAIDVIRDHYSLDRMVDRYEQLYRGASAVES